MALVCLLLGCGPAKIGIGPGEGGSSENGSSEGDSPGSETTESPTSESSTTGAETESSPGTDSSSGTITIGRDVAVVECDIFAQDCPEGEKCVPYASSGSSWDDYKCVPILGDQATGEPCVYAGVAESTDDCDGTGFCWDVTLIDGEPIGTCRAFCTGWFDNPECPPGSSCLIASFSIGVCISVCDPLLQDCNDGFACYWEGTEFSCIPTTADLPAGASCGYIDDCAGGQICLIATALPDCVGDGCCSPFCDLELGDAPCDAVLPGTSCVSFFPENQAPPGYENVGICMIAP